MVIEDNASPSREFVDENIQQMPEFSMTEYISSTDDQNSTLSKQNFTQKADEGNNYTYNLTVATTINIQV